MPCEVGMFATEDNHNLSSSCMVCKKGKLERTANAFQAGPGWHELQIRQSQLARLQASALLKLKHAYCL
jgi:hypothetical protein